MPDDPFNDGPVHNRIEALINKIDVRVIHVRSLHPNVWVKEHEKFKQEYVNDLMVLRKNLSGILYDLGKECDDDTD